MDKRTLKALHGSIRKWIKIATWEGTDEGPDNCPLCQEFLRNGCEGCPIAMKTHDSCCIGSPYSDWNGGFNDIFSGTEDIYNNGNAVFNYKTQKAAEKMTLFLIDLLPEEEKARYYVEE